MQFSRRSANPAESEDAMRNRVRTRLHSEPWNHQTGWVVYCQWTRRPFLSTGAVQVGGTTKNVGSGARYALQTFLGTESMVEKQFGASLAKAFTKRQEAIDFLNEMNIVDSVQNS